MLAPVRRRDDFDALSRSRARGRSGPIRVTRAEPTDPGRRLEHAHVAYAVPRAVGSAVVRNRARRRLRAMMVELGPDEGLTPALYLVGATPGVVDLAPSELRHHLVTALLASQPRAGRRRP